MARYTFVDLFAGCGGFSLGLSHAGLQGLFAIERDGMAFDTFSANLLEERAPRNLRFKWPAWLERKHWEIGSLLRQHEEELKDLRGKVDLLAGGPPCQGFSFAGRRRKDDPRNLLFELYVRIVRIIQPSIIVLENVPGMRVAHGKRPSSPHLKSFFDELVEQLGQAGYIVEGQIVDASKFGVPQARARLIVVGIRKDLASHVYGGSIRLFELLEANRRKQLEDFQIPDAVSVSRAISDLRLLRRNPTREMTAEILSNPPSYDGPVTNYQKLLHSNFGREMDSMRPALHRDYVIARYRKMLIQCERGSALSPAVREKFGMKKNRIVILDRKRPSPTITTLPDDIVHYQEPRILTVRECARLQSFPDWFVFRGKYTTGGRKRTLECPRYTQVGNAVPPFLARAIGLAAINALKEIEAGKAREAASRFVTSSARTA